MGFFFQISPIRQVHAVSPDESSMGKKFKYILIPPLKYFGYIIVLYILKIQGLITIKTKKYIFFLHL